MVRYYDSLIVRLSNRPERETIISIDEILSLVIDLNTLSVDSFLAKYADHPTPQRRVVRNKTSK